jgi:tetratricopeptide (TPR) repeat protein
VQPTVPEHFTVLLIERALFYLFVVAVVLIVGRVLLTTHQKWRRDPERRRWTPLTAAAIVLTLLSLLLLRNRMAADWNLIVGTYRVEHGAVARAAANFRALVQVSPTRKNRLTAANVLLWADDPAGAQRVVAPNVTVDAAHVAGDSSSVFALAIADYRLGRLDQASTLLQAILQARPKDDRVWYELGWVEIRMGRPGKAVGCFENAISSNPLSYPSLQGAVSLLLAHGDREKAEGLLHRYGPGLQGLWPGIDGLSRSVASGERNVPLKELKVYPL